MALDAFVYCDCFEKDNLRSNPPRGLKLKIAPSGEVICGAHSDLDWRAFTAWKHNKACLHERMILKHHRLGTVSEIDQLRLELESKGNGHFPILLRNVLYSGTHTCDWLPLTTLPKLTEELKHLEPQATMGGDALRHLRIQLAELIIAAQMVKKPICF